MPISQIGTASISGLGYGFKNRIINGAMSFWQRGTSFVDQGLAYTADRWLTNRGSNVTGITVSQSTSVPAGFQYSLALQRTAGNATTNTMNIYNSNESVNTLDLAGQSVTLSFYAKAGANYSGGALSIYLLSGTGTNERVYAFTGSTSVVTTTQAITTTWTRYSFTGSVPSNSTELGFYISWTPSGTAGADDTVYFTGVQLEAGTVATNFDYRPYGTELALCQRYYQQINGNAGNPYVGSGWSTSSSAFSMFLPTAVTMRAAPSFSYSGASITDGLSYGITISSITNNQSTTNGARIEGSTSSAGMTSGRPGFVYISSGNYVYFSSEL